MTTDESSEPTLVASASPLEAEPTLETQSASAPMRSTYSAGPRMVTRIVTGSPQKLNSSHISTATMRQTSE